jgi:hypothetical protein
MTARSHTRTKQNERRKSAKAKARRAEKKAEKDE